MALNQTFLSDLPGLDAEAIVPSDTVNQGPYRRIYVGVSGDVSLVTPFGNTVVFKAAPVGVLSMAAIRVNSTGTTATNMVGMT